MTSAVHISATYRNCNFLSPSFYDYFRHSQQNYYPGHPVACYQTKFTPPKKQSKSSSNLSSNIKKFLAKKEEEERQKALDAKKRKENLLALRDHKAQSRINKHLKVCKAANKSVLADAIDNDNTAVTMAGPSQPDEDDYGYVSQEASAFYNQLMNKYKNLPQEKPLFSESGKKTVKDIATTKDRVKQALKQQEIEDSSGHKRKRRSQVTSGEKELPIPEPDSKQEKERTTVPEKERDEKPRPKKRPLPPPMDFMQLLQIAEKKQHEPIVLETKPKPTKIEEPERLMTKKQMREHLKEKEWRERKEQRDRMNENSKNSHSPVNSGKTAKPAVNRIPKLNGTKSVPSSSVTEKNTLSHKPPIGTIPKKPSALSDRVGNHSSSNKPSERESKPSEKDKLIEERKKIEAEKKLLEEMRRSIEEEKKKLALGKVKRVEEKTVNGSSSKSKVPEQKLSGKDSKLRQALKPDAKPRQFLPADIKSRQFPPPDVRPARPKQFPPKDVKRKPVVKKRRIYDDDSEHDSELDDFIDDGPGDGAEDYSKYISEIFGYDKSKYRDLDEDDAGMESNFAQQLKEEYVSTKIGIMEDLEDIRMEALEKKKKALVKNKKPK
ncbi:protein SPT2 homolog isoform X1 [Neodiprion virginianus]|uniref:protein SPT2 homolog isoform X1 n=1 Tax=Neodiprion virginianus TaxID=2961670 RepID=UPI001EE6A7FE|nr:protein SPT2 homolog isoform X1 [Neodiprion virginianus]